MIYAGIDVGSLATKVVILKEGRIAACSVINSRTDLKKACKEALDRAIANGNCKREDIKYVVSTGYGRRSVSFASKTVTELTCHARGAYWLNPLVRTVIDIGGQDSKVIRVDNYCRKIRLLVL